MTKNDVICGGFSSIDWKNSGFYSIDPKCFIFSLKLMKVYKRLNDTYNLFFGDSYSLNYGSSSLAIYNNNKIYSIINTDPFKVP